jgi:outer membrane protein TolC
MASQFPNLFTPSPAFLFWTIAGSVMQTVFDGFTLEQRQCAAEAGWDQAAALYGSTLVTAFQNVADALQTVEFDGDAMRAALAARAADKSLKSPASSLSSDRSAPCSCSMLSRCTLPRF